VFNNNFFNNLVFNSSNFVRRLDADISALMSIQKTFEVDLEAKMRVEDVFTQEISAKMRVIEEGVTFLDAKMSIKGVVSQDLDAKMSVKKEIPRTIDAKMSVKYEVGQEVEAKMSVQDTLTKTIQAKLSILKTIPRTIRAKMSVKKEIEKTVEAKMHIILTRLTTVRAKMRIAKSYIPVPPQTHHQQPLIETLRTSFPTDSGIKPIWQRVEKTTLGGKTVIDSSAYKYEYKIHWAFMGMDEYDALEAIVNTNVSLLFVWDKFPQSTTGVRVYANLSGRTPKAYYKHQAYYSDITITLVEVENRL
jgi:hypothetical protein